MPKATQVTDQQKQLLLKQLEDPNFALQLVKGIASTEAGRKQLSDAVARCSQDKATGDGKGEWQFPPDTLAHHEKTLELLAKIRSVPEGPPRSKFTLYKAIRRTGVPDGIIYNEVLWNIVNCLKWQQHNQQLKKKADRAKDYWRSTRESVSDLHNLLFHIGKYHPEIFNELKQMGQAILAERLDNEMAERSVRLDDAEVEWRSTKKAYEQAKQKGTTKPTLIELHHITYSLCGCFRDLSGHPHYGLVGRLLLVCGVTDKDGTYKQLTDKAKYSAKQWEKWIAAGKNAGW